MNATPAKTFEYMRTVGKNDLIVKAGNEAQQILSLPSLTAWMEKAAVLCLNSESEKHCSIGVKLDVNILAPALLGAKIRIKAELGVIVGNKYTFNMEAYDEHEQIASATHVRAVVNIETFKKKLRIKAPAELPLLGKVIVIPEVDSTNAHLKRRHARLNNYTALVSFTQKRAKGRFGRFWETSEGSLNFSIILKAKTQVPFVSLICSLAAADTIEHFSNLAVELKWPNDLLVNNKKIGGVLVENIFERPYEECNVIAGIGINIGNSSFSQKIEHFATSIFLETSKTYDVVDVGKYLANQIISRFTACAEGDSVIEEYKKRCSTLNRRIRVTESKDSFFSGKAVNIGKNGCLIVKTNKGEMVSADAESCTIRYF